MPNIGIEYDKLNNLKYGLLNLGTKDIDAMLVQAELLVTSQEDMREMCAELQQDGYEATQESGDGTTPVEIEELITWLENNIEEY